MAKARAAKLKLDMMSVVVLLVMSVFGGIVGYYLGQSSGSANALFLREAGTIMQEKGAFMKSTGQMMEEKGTRYRDAQLTEQGKTMMQDGSTMMGKGESMMGSMMQKGY